MKSTVGMKIEFLESIVIVQSARRTADIQDLNINIYLLLK